MCFPALLNLMMPIWTGKKKRREGRQRNRKSKDFCYVVPEQAGRFPVPQNEHYKKYQAASAKRFAQDLIAPGIYHRQITGDSLRTGGEANAGEPVDRSITLAKYIDVWTGARWRQRNWRPVQLVRDKQISGGIPPARGPLR